MHLKHGGQEGKQRTRTWKKFKENISRKLEGGSSTVAGVAIRGIWAEVSWRREGKKRNYYWMEVAENE